MPIRQKTEAGFTLIEAVIVITITAIIAAVVAVFIKAPIRGYFDSVRRAEMTDTGDTALRRLSRDLHLAVPNSVRVIPTAITPGATYYLEFLQSNSGGYYRSQCSVLPCPVGENILDFTIADTGFDVLGGFPAQPAADQPVVGDLVVVYNLGTTGADAYSGNNTSAITAMTATSLSIAPFRFPFDSPAQHFQIIDSPVTYVCTQGSNGTDGTGTLTRISGYTITAAQATPPTLGAGIRTTLLASKVSGCEITDPINLPQPGYALVTIKLTLQNNGEVVTLYHEAHINNVP